MSHPLSDPDREQRQRTNSALVSRVDLFSHPAQPEMLEQHRQPADADDGVDWQAAPFSGGAAGSAEPRGTVVDVRDAPQAGNRHDGDGVGERR